MEATLTAQDLALAILDGKFDEDLDAITGAVRQRRKQVDSIKLLFCGPGDTVQFNSTIRPKYLQGLTATVVKVNKTTITVTCPDDPRYGRFQNSKAVKCPSSLFDKVEAAD